MAATGTPRCPGGAGNPGAMPGLAQERRPTHFERNQLTNTDKCAQLRRLTHTHKAHVPTDTHTKARPLLTPHLLAINTAPIAAGAEEMRFGFCNCERVCVCGCV